MLTKLHLEALEARLALTVFDVGQGHAFPTLAEVPWDALHPGDTVQIHWQRTPYHNKVAINVSGTERAPIQIVGVPGPQGQLPIIDASEAVENPQATYYSNQISAQGIFTIAPGLAGNWEKPNWIQIGNLELQNATRNNYFYSASGEIKWYNTAAAGVAIYKADNITIFNCTIHDNENGIFGKSLGYFEGDLHNIRVQGNTIYGNGVVGADHYHNTYIEGIGTVYEYNHYGAPKAGSAALNLKDRGAGTIIRYNWIEGGLHLLDLVDPDGGAPSFTEDPLFGTTYVYGNILINPEWSSCSAMIHFGWDENPANAQQTLYFFSNTVVSVNDRDAGGRWYTYVFKVHGDQTVIANNNIFHSFSPDGNHFSGDFYLITGGGTLLLGVNFVPAWSQIGSVDSVRGTANLMRGDDPGFVDQANFDFRLAEDSPCRNAQEYSALGDKLSPMGVEYQFDYDLGGWVERDSTNNLGALE